MIGLEEQLFKLKVIISEVDGVLNSGEHPIDELGNVQFKVFNFKDFEAINELKKHFKVVFVSADNKINFHLFRGRNIPFFYNNKDKTVEISKVLRRYSITPEEALYVGCTFSDLKCMNMIPFSICTDDAISDVKNIASTVLPVYGGMGVFCMLYDLLKPEIKRRMFK